MFTTSLLVSLASLPLAAIDTQNAPRTIESPSLEVTRVGLFKNGIAAVHAVLELPGQGTYAVEEIPDALHGTFWVESPSDVIVRSTTRWVQQDPVPAAAGGDHRSSAFLPGAIVTIRLREQHLPTVTGTVIGHAGVAASGQYVELATDTGPVLIERSQIAMIEVIEPGVAPVAPRPLLEHKVLEVTVPATADGPSRLAVTWLTNGMTWAPSYAIDMLGESQLDLRQKAVIRNEWRDLADVEFELITGFPGIEFAHVHSLMSPTTTMYDFFRELGQRNRLTHPSRGDVMAQMVTSNSVIHGDVAAPAELTASDGADLYYHAIGRLTVAKGESVMINTANGRAAFDPVVYWRIAADDRAHSARTTGFDNPLLGAQTGMWDSLRFKNPLSIPMTTAPALVRRNGRILGQQTTWWTAPGEQMLLPVTRALSIRTDHELTESDRTSVRIASSNRTKTTYDGTIKLTNFRDRPVEMIISRVLVGTLESSDDAPDVEVIDDAASLPRWNATQEVRWTITLQPGERREVNYQFSVIS